MTGAALAGSAAEMHTGDAEPAAQHVEQHVVRISVHGDRIAVEPELKNGHEQYASGLVEFLDDVGPFLDVATQEFFEFLRCH